MHRWMLTLGLLSGCGSCGTSSAPALEVVPPGSFTMGSDATEPCRGRDEDPVAVTLRHHFAIEREEVTQRRFEEAMGYNPSFRRGCPTCPVERVTHHEAAAFCNALSPREGLPPCYACSGEQEGTRCEVAAPSSSCGYRLPTEAEWAWAVRGGDPEGPATYGGRVASCMSQDEVADRIGWYKANAGGFTHPVGTLEPNRAGLYDMTGNVYEWTADWYAPLAAGVNPQGPPQGTERVLRGGSWYHNAHHLRSASRFRLRPDERLSYVGFRCAKTVSS